MLLLLMGYGVVSASVDGDVSLSDSTIYAAAIADSARFHAALSDATLYRVTLTDMEST